MKGYAPHLLLACFLRMQVACCCAEHHASPTPTESLVWQAPVHEATATLREAHPDCRHGAPFGPTAPHRDCHICVIAHLHYVPATHLAPIDLLDAGLATMIRLEELGLLHAEFHTPADRFALLQSSLLSCGSLLRI